MVFCKIDVRKTVKKLLTGYRKMDFKWLGLLEEKTVHGFCTNRVVRQKRYTNFNRFPFEFDQK